MECLWWFLKLWAWLFWGFDGFKSSGLLFLLVLGLGLMLLHLQISCLIRLAGKWGGLCSKSDLGDRFWDEKLWSCIKCFLASILCPYVIQQCRDSALDLSEEVFFDCIAHGGDQPSKNVEGRLADCCSSEDEADWLFWDCEEEDGVFDAQVPALREMVELERQRADSAVVELEKERLANASAAEEAMGMILRLQNEKSLIQIEAHNYRKMAEQKMLYDQETIQFLRYRLHKHQSERRLLEERLKSCRHNLRIHSLETEVDQFEGLNFTFSDFTMDDFYKSENAILEFYS